MYKILYDNDFLFDPFDDSRVVYNASITNNINAASYLDFTVTSAHPMYDKIEERSGIITVYWDNEELFQGQITKIELDLDGNKTVACSSALDWLREVQLRPYSTDEAECKEYEFPLDKAPESLDGYFQWVIDQYNATNLDDRRFDIEVNQANGLTPKNHVYFASTSPQTVADAIESNILDAYGGYLVLRYDDHRLVLDLYSDIHEMNPQIIDFAENILDITKTEDTNDQYTAVLPLGKSPQYTAKQQKYHDEKDAYDKRMKERDAAQKSKIDRLRKEEEAERKRIDGIKDKKAKKAAQDALKRRQDARQKDENAFSKETERLQNEQKIKDDANNADKTKTNPIDISSLPDGGLPTDLDLYKKGDVVYSMTAVERYGYKEYVYTDNDVEDKQELLRLAGVMLRKLMAPALSIDVKAIDRALYQPEHTHLFVGQAVRVRSKIHGIDEFMMVSSINLDLTDPSQTTATLGVAYDTLTGQQSSYLKSLNSQIDASVDVVTKVEDNIKNTEITLGQVQQVVTDVNDKTDLVINTVDDYKWMTDTAWGKADDAQADADKANQGVTDTNIRIDNIKLATDERIDDMETDISGINTEISNTKAEIVTIKENAEQIRQDAQTGIEEANQKAEDIRTEANTAIDKVKTDLAATETKAQQAASNASAALGGLSSANTDITNLRTEVDRHTENLTNINGEIVGVRDTISGVAETANSALSVATTNTHAINEQSTRIDTAYSDIESTRTSVSEVKQTADGLKVNLETNYLDKNAIGNAYASKLELSATSESITSTVSKTYATKAALEGLQNIADAAIETWSGQTVPTASNPPASTWTTDVLKRQHSGDIYYDMSSGKSYRWGSVDGTAYSWSMIADSDITKAIADAAKAQQTADGAKQDVVNLSDNVKATYTSKSEFKQTSDEIKASVSEVASANETNAQKIAEVSVKADGISAKVAEQAETINGHTTTIGQLSVKADGLQTKFEQVSGDISNLNKSLTGLINPNFANKDYGWVKSGASFRLSTYDATLNGPYLVAENFSNGGTYQIINKGLLSLIPKHTYRISLLMHVNRSVLKEPNIGMTVRMIKSIDPYAIYNDYFVSLPANKITDNQFANYSIDWVCPEKVTQGYFRMAAITNAGTGGFISVKSVDIVDITEGSAALTKTSELQQNLDGFKQTVSETYTTKDEFDNLQIGGRNLLLNTKTSKQVVGNNGTNQWMTLYNLSTYSWAHLDPGEYMISADISYEGTISGTLRFQRDNKPWEFEPTTLKKFSDIVSNTKRKAHIEFCVKNAYDGASKGLAVRFDNVQGTVTFSNMKLEKGNKATTWSPAPEDLLDTATASTTYTTKSEFTQTAKEIKGTVAEQATTIAGHTDTISTLSLKADKFETDISQVTEQATAIAGRTTKLEQDLGGFKQTVKGTYITKTDAEQNLIDAINGIQIGGSNMLLDTQKFGRANPNNVADTYGRLININAATGTGSTNLENTKYANGFVWRGIPSSNTANNADGPRYQVTVKPGGVYTFSFEASTTAGFWVYFYGPNGYIKVKKTICSTGTPMNNTNGDGAVQFNAVGAKFKRHEITWELDSTGSTNVKYVLFRRVGSTGYTTFMAPKLEEGNKATEWSPSPFDTLYASNIEKTYAPKAMVQQTEDRITQTVEAKYATKTQLSDEMKQSLKTTELRGRMDGDYWFKLGRLTMEQQGKDFHIDFTGGRGYNANTSQNSQLEIHVRSSNGSGTLFFAVTLNRLLNADMYQVKAFTIDSTHIDLYIKSGSQFSTGTMAYYGQYRDFSGWKQIDDISTAEGTELEVFEQSLSSKTYVEQKANSVAIGVVEDYKDGRHGDKLTTSADITVLKDEINQTVQKNYADLSDQIKLIGSENVVGKNFSFESNNFDGWASHDRWTIGTNGAHTGRYYAQNTIPANSPGNQLISTGSIAAEYGHTYKLEYWVKKKPNSQCRGVHRISYKRSGVWEDMPSDIGTTIFLDENCTTNTTSGRDYFTVGDNWTKVTAYIVPPSNVTELRVRIIGTNPGGVETVYAVDDVSLTDYSVAKTINKTMAGIDIKADSIVQEVRNDYATKDLVNRSIPGLKNPNFDVQKNGDYRITGWSVLGPWNATRLSNSASVNSEGGTYFIGQSGTTAGQTLELINQGYISAYPNMKVQISWWMSADPNMFKDSNFSAGIIANNVVTRNLVSHQGNGQWKHMTTTVTVPANVNQFRVRFGFVTTGTSGWLRLDSVSVTDVTEAKAAMGKANTAVSTLDEFKRTVSNTYVTNDKLTKVQTEWKHTANGFEANIGSISKSIPVIDGTFESNGDGWRTCRLGNTLEEGNLSLSGGIISNVLGNRTKSLYISDSQARVSNSGRIVATENNILMVSGRFCAINSNGGAVSGVTLTPGLLGRHNSAPYSGTRQTSTSGWTAFRVPIKVDAGTYSVLLTVGNLGGNRIVLDDITLENNTEGASARKDIDDLNTRIAMTAKGVRVGKIQNDKFIGGNVLMNADDGSFDILNGDETRNRFTADSIDLAKNSDGSYQYRLIPFTQQGTGSVTTVIQGINMVSLGYFALNGIPATPVTFTVGVNSGEGNSVPNNTYLKWDQGVLKDRFMVLNAKNHHDQFYADMDAGRVPDSYVFRYPVSLTNDSDGSTTVSKTAFMVTAPSMYMIQGQWNGRKPATGALCDVALMVRKYNSTTYGQMGYTYRFSETGDPIGWTTKGGPIWAVELDAGDRIAFMFKPQGGKYEYGSLNWFSITRLPFSGLDFRLINKQ